LAYGFILNAYRNTYAYIFVSAYQWIMLLVSGICWCMRSAKILRSGAAPKYEEGQVLSWYGAFAVLGVASLVVDFAAASNWQLRVYGLGVILTPPVILTTFKAIGRIRSRMWLKPAMVAVSVLGICSVLLLSTADPLVMTVRPSYDPLEVVSMNWLATHGGGTVRDDVNLRLAAAWLITQSPKSATELSFYPAGNVTFFLQSPLSQKAPGPGWPNILYDNGFVQVHMSAA
jgi:hypothetical protein